MILSDFSKTFSQFQGKLKHNCEVKNILAMENVFRVCIAWYKHERGWENSSSVQIRDEVEGLHNRQEFSQPLECLYQDMQTQEKSFLLLL